ncbi:SusC/RagA family TonB-linked outer membrane protein [Arcticibacter eurypsychrophilus]|uniref:SusC/RagA family TonB-linked outer membrane protein n=1 Tax=Arcticibacter eurypsychrophilus TaxID=1434752 RepID=UPI00084D5D35|nr:TonB-dependent receptor [Arcticibacter eurypsychrophilus]
MKNFYAGLFLFLYLFAQNSEVLAQEKTTVTGMVQDIKGLGLPGVSINLSTNKGIGTTTDLEGKFKLAVPTNSIVRFSYIGFESQDISLKGKTQINVILLENPNALEEVVVVGYGSQKRGNLTGSVASINSAEISRSQVASVSNALAGKLPGLITLQSNGMPGSDQSTLNIRGFGSPLVLINGIEGNINSIDANEIESISILKDASASIYGARAGNGVILITTKRGVLGKPIISFKTSFTAQGITSMPEPGSSGMYAQILREGWIQGGQPEETAPYTAAEIQKFYDGTDPQYPNTDWFGLLVRDWAPQQQHSVSVRGGSEAIKYFGFLGYLDQETIMKRSDASYSRYNLRSNIDAKITRGLRATMDFSTIIEDGKFPSRNLDVTNSIWSDLWNTRPTSPAVLPDPTKVSWAEGGGTGGAHITGDRSLSGYSDYKNQDLRFNFDLTYDFAFLKGLQAKGLINYVQGYGSTKKFQKPVAFYTYDYAADIYSPAGNFGTSANLNLGRTSNRQINRQLSLKYDKTINTKHDFSILALYEDIDYFNDAVQAARSNFLTPAIDEILAGSTEGMTNGGSTSEMGRKSLVGRVNYTYLNRYIFETSIRADASAKFPTSSRWGYFPSVSVGWRVEQESFMKSFESIDALKLRASYGMSGNDGVGNFQYLTGYEITGVRTGGSYIFGNTKYPGLVSKGLANPDLTWENLKIFNGGLDLSLWNGLLYANIDAFYRKRTGIPGTRTATLPSSFGATLPPENINSTDTRGFELVLGTSHRSDKFDWNIGANLSWARSKWLSFDEPDYTDPDQIRQNKKTGNWTDRTFGYRSDGLFTSQEEINNLPYDQDLRKNVTLRPGDVKYLDMNNDAVIDWKDQVEIGKGTFPSWMYGINTSFRYKSFDLALLLQGAFGFNIRAVLKQNSVPPVVYFENRWTEENNDKYAFVPRVGGAASNGWLSDYNLVNSSYLRLKSLNIGYSLSSSLLKSINISQVRFFVAGTNLLTFSKLNKFELDPESPSGLGSIYYPQLRNVSLGLDLSF